MPESIVEATSAADYAAFGLLIRDYLDWLRARWAERPGLIDDIASHQGIDEELASLATRYGPPAGRTLLVVVDGTVVGAGAYHDLHDGSCEMKRVFVPDHYQGHGYGRRLCAALVARATEDGYASMLLDTGVLNVEAATMYRSMGFSDRGPYQDYPPGMVQHLLFMEKPLTATAG
jgi:GNAT superfamily N-acetyltransferase